MTKCSKKTIEIDIEQEQNILDVFTDAEKQNLNLENLSPNSNIVKCQLELFIFLIK